MAKTELSFEQSMERLDAIVKQLEKGEAPLNESLKLFEEGRGDFILESVEGGAVRGRHSLIGLAPDLVFRANACAAEINRNWQTDRKAFIPTGEGALASLRKLVEACRIDMPEGLPAAFACLARAPDP